MEPQNRELLIAGARALGAGLDDEAVSLFDCYLAALEEWGKAINLTGLKDERDRVIKLLLDSLGTTAAIRELGPTLKLLDLGSGAGLPGIPLKIVIPELELTLLEARQKRAVFLREAVRRLGLAGVGVVAARAEDYGRSEGSAVFEAVIARAVAELSELVKWSAPLLAEGGSLLAMKGPEPEAEIAGAERELTRRGMAVKKVLAYSLPEGAGQRTVVVIGRRSA